MSFGSGYNGGRTRMSTKVFLNVYDLSPMNDCLYSVGMGLHHAGVEILGSEYSFASGAGIFEAPPRMAAPGAVFREQIDMGAFEGTSSDLKRVIADLQSDFRAQGDYNLVTKNCNHFANALCWRLMRKQIPAHVNRLANLGAYCTCLLPRQMLESAPVGDPNNAANNGSGESKSFLVHAPPGRQQQQGGTNSGETPVFSGSGARLGGSSMTSTPSTTPMDRGGGGGLFGKWTSSSSTTESSSSSSSTSANGSSGSDLTDRRERARKAALARLEQNISQQTQQQSPSPKQN